MHCLEEKIMAANHSYDNSRLVTVFGGSGFLGRHVVQALARRGYRVRVAMRRPDLGFHLLPLGDPGQIKPLQANVRIAWSVDNAVNGADIVINLTGTFNAFGKNRLEAVHVDGARNIAQAAKNHDAKLIHVSALGANLGGKSRYARSKAEGEQSVFEADAKAIILRPSILFGAGDAFFNRFGAMAMASPVLPLIGGNTRFQPIYVGDVAEAIAQAADGNIAGGKIYELGGPQNLSFRQCLELMLETIDRKRLLLPVPFFAARFLARATGWLPGAPISYDQVLMLEVDNIVSDAAKRQNRTLDAFDVSPKTLRSVLPSYLVRFRPEGEFTRKGEA